MKMESHQDIKEFYQVYRIVRNSGSFPHEPSYAMAIADHSEYPEEEDAYNWIANTDERHTSFVILKIFKKS
jgi:hypothetical protein